MEKPKFGTPANVAMVIGNISIIPIWTNAPLNKVLTFFNIPDCPRSGMLVIFNYYKFKKYHYDTDNSYDRKRTSS